jgi:endonuclease/exonuclease/phosphatase family metal-dependent hydrolase
MAHSAIAGRIFLLFLLVPAVLEAQALQQRGDVRLMWYNVENLFHPGDDSLAGDDEFTPDGIRHWTFGRYRGKLARLAKVIVAAGQWEPPDLVGLGEVENAQVLEELISHPILAPYRYGYLHSDSPDHRGMDVACLFREDRFRPAGWSAIPPVSDETFGNTRKIIHTWGTWGRGDTLDIFLVHFISRFRGSGATAEYRKRQANQLLILADSVHRVRPGSLKIMAGDFNEPWEGSSLEPLRVSPAGNDSIHHVIMSDSGTSYKYRGDWSGIDMFLVVGECGRYRISGSVFRIPVLLTRDETYGGEKPFITYEGTAFTGGISDHLPILLDISRPLFSTRSER